MAPNGMASEMNKLVSIAALLAVPLSACTTVGPDYDAPGAGALNVPASYYSVEATPGSPEELARWWTRFTATVLTRLDQQALSPNLEPDDYSTRPRTALAGLLPTRPAPAGRA